MTEEAKNSKPTEAGAARRWTSDELARTAKDVAGARRMTHPGRTALTIVIALLLAGSVWACAVNPNFGWATVWAYLFDRSVLTGIEMTLSLTVISMVLGTVLGLVCAMLKMSGMPFFAGLADLYLWFFRSTPLLVQLLFWYNLAALFPNLGIPGVWMVPTNDVITPLTAAIVGLSLNEGAYMGEIIRAGLQSVDPAQRETAEAFGMSRRQILFRVMLPQAMRSIIPPTGNQVISMVKATAMVSVIAMDDLLYSVQTIYNENFQIIPLLLVAVIWYLVITSVLTVVQAKIERHYRRGERDSGYVPEAPQPTA
ncbi:amino acid ABC transporter permease [Sutterella sp.]|uniref:amino acid ABC transporter permease n=1 Tax=Sutterella sp. TaxID=1981025 RepID=UPI003FD7BB95